MVALISEDIDLARFFYRCGLGLLVEQVGVESCKLAACLPSDGLHFCKPRELNLADHVRAHKNHPHINRLLWSYAMGAVELYRVSNSALLGGLKLLDYDPGTSSTSPPHSPLTSSRVGVLK